MHYFKSILFCLLAAACIAQAEEKEKTIGDVKQSIFNEGVKVQEEDKVADELAALPDRKEEIKEKETVEADANTITAQIEEAALKARERVPETQAEKDVREYLEKVADRKEETLDDTLSLETRLKEALKPVAELAEGSDEKIVAERADERWKLHKEIRFESEYEKFISPLQKKSYSYRNFLGRYGAVINYNEVRPDAVACEKHICIVKLYVGYYVPQAKVNASTYLYETWIKEDGTWYFYLADDE